MSAEMVVPQLDQRTARQLARDTAKGEKNAQKRLTSRGATIAAIIIGIVWTIPTFGLFVTSDRKSTRLNSSHLSQSRMPSSA